MADTVHDVYAGVAVSSTTVYRSAKTGWKGDGFRWVRLKYTNASGSGNIYGYYHGRTYVLEWTGTPTGTFVVQVSNHDDPSDASDTGWVTLTLDASITQPAGSASGDFVDLRV